MSNRRLQRCIVCFNSTSTLHPLHLFFVFEIGISLSFFWLISSDKTLLILLVSFFFYSLKSQEIIVLLLYLGLYELIQIKQVFLSISPTQVLHLSIEHL